MEQLRLWALSIQACAPGFVVILVGSHADEAASPAAAGRTCTRVLEQLTAALEEQHDGLRADLARLEAELPDEDQRRATATTTTCRRRRLAGKFAS